MSCKPNADKSLLLVCLGAAYIQAKFNFRAKPVKLLMPIGARSAVFGLLTGTAAAMGTGDVGLFLGLCLRLLFLGGLIPYASSPDDAFLDDSINIVAFAHYSIFNLQFSIGQRPESIFNSSKV